MFQKFPQVRFALVNAVRSSHFLLNILALLALVSLTVATHASRSRSTLDNLALESAQDVFILEEREEEVLAAVDEVLGKVIAATAEDREFQGETGEQQKSADSGVKGRSNPLCRGVSESWKMIPDPNHAGQYIICNTESEKMTTVDELNRAQNNYRGEHGLNQLNINGQLCKIAANRAAEIAKDFSHGGFESAVKGSGLGKSSYGENIASGPLSGVHFVEWSWDKSPGHRENMLGDWTDGCGGVFDKYAVFLFAK